MTDKLTIVRMFPAQEQRVETGPIQFGLEDWPGMFIRGDNAFALIMAIRGTLAGETMSKVILEGWVRTLLECNVNDRLTKAIRDEMPSPANQLRAKIHLAVTQELIRQKGLVAEKSYPDGYWLVDAIIEALRR